MNQHCLTSAIQTIFKGCYIRVNTRRDSNIQNPDTGKYVEVDISLPDHRLCFEFQDRHHYATTWYSQSTLRDVTSKDNSKQASARLQGDTLVAIPCWWEGGIEGLISTIRFLRPDLAQELSVREQTPIHLNPPVDYFASACGVPDVGELMLASFLPPDGVDIQLNETASGATHLSSWWWWLGEKYDGIRVCWNVYRRQLYTRFGVAVKLEDSIHEAFPNAFLDGELWFGRGTFADMQQVASIRRDAYHQHPSRSHSNSRTGAHSQVAVWRFLRLVAFDVAQIQRLDSSGGVSGASTTLDNNNINNNDINNDMNNSNNNDIPFEVRYETLLKAVRPDHPLVQMATRVFVTTNNLLLKLATLVISNGGEGVVLRRPISLYEHGRSQDVLKMKASRNDEEGIVLHIETNGSIVLKSARGVVFTVPRQNAELIASPSTPPSPSITIATPLTTELKIGDVVTYSYDSSSSLGTPINPHITRIRTDVSWKELAGYEEVLGIEHTITVQEPKSIRHGSFRKRDSQRQFLVEFAHHRNLDPLLPATWYTVSQHEIYATKGGSTIVRCFKGNYRRMLSTLFPDIGLDESKFTGFSIGARYQNVKNRRKLLDSFARLHGFDPLVANNWYKTPPNKLVGERMRGVLRFYSDSLARAVQHLYPEVEIKSSSFPTVSWRERSNRKQLLIQFAEQHGFNPHIVSNWCATPMDMLNTFKGMKTVLSRYKHSLPAALADLFPDMHINHQQFSACAKNYWQNLENRRQFLVHFAERSGFNHLVSENWYPISQREIVEKRGAALLSVYQNSLSKMLIHVFPDIGIKEYNFHRLPRNYWLNLDNVKAFFVDAARDNGFDPLVPDNWYLFNVNQTKVKVRGLVEQYSHSLPTALIAAFPSIGLDRDKFRSVTFKEFYSDKQNSRKFFERYAKEHGFDPLRASNWYSVQAQHCWGAAVAGSRALADMYSQSLSLALLDVFPDIGLDRSMFLYPKNYWTHAGNRRKLFTEIAHKLGFDPLLDPEKWFTVSKKSIMNFKGAHRVTQLCGNSVIKTAKAVFPDIDFTDIQEKRHQH